MSNKVLEIVIKARDEATKTLNGLSSTLKDNEKAFKGMATAGTVAIAGVTAVIATSVKAYAESERSQRQLEHAIIGVSKGTKEQVKQVNDLTSALQKKAGIDGDALNAGVAQLSTFGLQSSSVVALTKSLADLTINQNGVTAGADQYISSANIMAKALNGQFGILEKSGIRFTETQQKLIQFGTETERISALQEGFAQNLRETTDTVAGYDVMLGQATQSFGEIQESIGKGLQPVLIKLAETLVPVIQKVSDWIIANPELTANIILGVGAIALLVAGLGALGLVLPSIIAGFTLMLGPVGLVIAIIGALAFAVTNVTKIFLIFQNDLGLVWSGIKEIFKEGVESITKLFTPLFDVIEKVKNAMSSIGDGIKSTISSVTKKVTGKAVGGGVQVGQSYLVGEKGPELFTPSSNGSILPNYKLAGGGGTNLTINLNGGTYLDDNVAEKIGDKIIQSFKLISRF